MGTRAGQHRRMSPVRPEPLPAPPAHVELWVDSGLFGRSIGCRHSIGPVERLARGVIALRTKGLPETDLSLGSSYLVLGECLGWTGRPADGATALREALRLRLEVLPEAHWGVADVRSVLGEVLVRAGQVEEGRRLLDEGYRRMTAAVGPDHPRSRQAKVRLERWTR